MVEHSASFLSRLKELFFPSAVEKSPAKEAAREPAKEPVAEQHRSPDETRDYWRTADNGLNTSANYVNIERLPTLKTRSEFLVDWVSRVAGKDASVFELGCNAGRNLEFLRQGGISRLSAIEINADALSRLHTTYPELSEIVNVEAGSAEDLLKLKPDDSFDLVYTMAVLEHIHSDSEWIFGELVRITSKWLLIIEDEFTHSSRHFPRKYKEIFEGLGMTQVEEVMCNKDHGLPSKFRGRLFVKNG